METSIVTVLPWISNWFRSSKRAEGFCIAQWLSQKNQKNFSTSTENMKQMPEWLFTSQYSGQCMWLTTQWFQVNVARHCESASKALRQKVKFCWQQKWVLTEDE